jgi:hypothetical protein
MSHIPRIALTAAAASALSACASGPAFEPVDSVPPGHAVVYVYRPSANVAKFAYWNIHMNGVPVGELDDGDYIRTYPPAGDVRYTGEWDVHWVFFLNRLVNPGPDVRECSLTVEEGRTYYVRHDWGKASLLGYQEPALVETTEEVALEQIRECELDTDAPTVE